MDYKEGSFNFLTLILKSLTIDFSTKEGIAGVNGPYRDAETGVRAKAHMIALLSNLDRAGNTKQHQQQVEGLVTSLLESEHRLAFSVFEQRKKPGKDEVNGVIGIAWIIEAMCCAYQTYGTKEAKIFLQKIEGELNFNTNRALWTRPVLPDNKYYKTIDETFNHQLWLAYGLVFKAKALGEPLSANVQAYFDNLNRSFKIHNSGLIIHAVHYSSSLKSKVKTMLKSLRDGVQVRLLGKTKKYKENGYHLFNMFAFARMADLGYADLFAANTRFKKALEYTQSSTLLAGLCNNEDEQDFYKIEPFSNLPYNRYGFPYNVAGLEFVYVDKVLDLKVSKKVKECYWESQMKCYDQGKLEDPVLLTEDVPNLYLRAYELSFVL